MLTRLWSQGSDHVNLARKVIVPPWAVKLCHFIVQYEGLSRGQSIPIRMAGPPGGVPATARTHSQVAFRLDDVAMTICSAGHASILVGIRVLKSTRTDYQSGGLRPMDRCGGAAGLQPKQD